MQKTPKSGGNNHLNAKQPNKVKSFITNWLLRFKKTSTIKKVLIVFLLIFVLFLAQAYAIAFWYQQKHKNEPVNFGVTFISNYAEYYGLDPQQTMYALRDDLGFKRFRLVSYWKDIETSPGVYDFSELDWQFKAVNEVNGQVTLALGLRQPRWPECHAPAWVDAKNQQQWYPQLLNFTQAVIDRYKDNPALVSYQLENEYFLSVFGECQHFGAPRSRLVDEFNFVKKIDPNTPIILSYANNYFGVATGKPRGDVYGVSVYDRVFESRYLKRYVNYPFAPWYYSWRAGLQQILTGRPSMLHELQTEPWAPTDIKSASTQEQYKSMSPKILQDQIKFGLDTGFKDIDLWGGEWWYWRKQTQNDPKVWEAVRESINSACSKQDCVQ
jgi:hypothetical protein